MFENFNLIKYSLTNNGKDLSDFILTDIFTRTKLTAPEDAFFYYRISPGETPEQVSHRVYGNPFYHWTILMINDIYDVYDEWFMSDEMLHEYVKTKYNIVHSVTPANINVSTNTFTVTNHKFKPTDAVTITGRELPGGIVKNTTYYIMNTTTNTFQLCKVVNNTPMFVYPNYASNTFDTGGFNHGMQTGCKVKFLSTPVFPSGLNGTTEYFVVNAAAQQFQVSLTEGGLPVDLTDPAQTISLQIILQPMDVTSVGAYNITITCDKTALPHSYVDEQQNIMHSALVDYTGWDNNFYTRNELLNGIEDIINAQPSRYAYQSATNKTILDIDNDVIEVTEGVTPADQIDDKTISVLTNFDYEAMMNARKQVVKMLKPEYIKKFVDRFNEVVRG